MWALSVIQHDGRFWRVFLSWGGEIVWVSRINYFWGNWGRALKCPRINTYFVEKERGLQTFVWTLPSFFFLEMPNLHNHTLNILGVTSPTASPPSSPLSSPFSAHREDLFSGALGLRLCTPGRLHNIHPHTAEPNVALGRGKRWITELKLNW